MSFASLRKFLSVATSTLVLFAAGNASAHLIISPQRFVFENRVRSQTIMLLNDDNEQHTYRLVWKMMKMDEQGVYHDVPLDDKDAFSVPKMVVYSPRQVTLAAAGRQSVRMALRAPANLPKGEYRAHLDFEQVVDDRAPAPAKTEQGKQGQTINIKIAVSVTVPVIVRVGDMPVGNITFANPKMKPNGPKGETALALDLVHPQGDASAYGVVKIKSGETDVGILANVALYPEQSKRSLLIPLIKPVAAGTPVTVVYEGDGEYKGKTITQQQITLQ